jgi:hypothetical protein
MRRGQGSDCSPRGIATTQAGWGCLGGGRSAAPRAEERDTQAALASRHRHSSRGGCRKRPAEARCRDEGSPSLIPHRVSKPGANARWNYEQAPAATHTTPQPSPMTCPCGSPPPCRASLRGDSTRQPSEHPCSANPGPYPSAVSGMSPVSNDKRMAVSTRLRLQGLTEAAQPTAVVTGTVMARTPADQAAGSQPLGDARPNGTPPPADTLEDQERKCVCRHRPTMRLAGDKDRQGSGSLRSTGPSARRDAVRHRSCTRATGYSPTPRGRRPGAGSLRVCQDPERDDRRARLPARSRRRGRLN